MAAVPEWTELGQEGGLDPLGMQRPIEVIYQALIPGISTITLRLRYYSFFCWMLEAYASKIGNTDPQEFRIFHRRCELLYALIAARGPYETGVTGIEWAQKQVAKIQGAGDPNVEIAFADGAHPDTSGDRYLKNKAGAFGAIYSTQMQDIGLVLLGTTENPVPVCTERGLALAKAFAEILGDASETILDAVASGKVSMATLDALGRLKPGALNPEGAECRLLIQLLLGLSPDGSGADLRRRDTMKMLLQLTASRGAKPRADDAKWTWLEAEAEPGNEGRVQSLWTLYQLSDLLRLAYEYIMDAGLKLLAIEPSRHLSLGALVTQLVQSASLPNDLSWSQFCMDGSAEKPVRQLYAGMVQAKADGNLGDQVSSAFALIAKLVRRATDLQTLIDDVLPAADYFQSLRSELKFLAAHSQASAEAVGTLIIRDRVIKRHLWVASRKFRNQRAYTYLMEPADGLLRYRDDITLSPSSPRLDQALNFLSDAKLIDERGLTAFGQRELAPS
ncbi:MULTISPECIES: hypothetical protein [Asticcacaulis]|uniref:hypothetical protein n=1 Tax=Asticcacaulis TaxID=76890 RepID=UPI001AE72D7C|nr:MULTISPECIES: hypothetical protein [Asticcacaulis]MBP2159121.1 hypothetical protein [Asticcacaulis solisilvae]MDR6800166.1 hypothetical protein [Asticcacaulis sp. BE141]